MDSSVVRVEDYRSKDLGFETTILCNSEHLNHDKWPHKLEGPLDKCLVGILKEAR